MAKRKSYVTARFIGKNGARTRTAYIVQDGERHYQRHAIELVDPVLTVAGETLPRGTKATVLSRGAYDGRMSFGLSLWGDGRQVNVFSEGAS